MTFLYFIIALGLLVFVHEFGHFLLAKKAGICVEVFSFGFGPRLFGLKRGDTDYRVSALPLGGYVRMLGEDPEEADVSDPRSFAAKGVWTRVKVILFGPLMNFLLCFSLMPVVFMIGRSEPSFLKEAPVITNVRSDSPADRAGLKPHDRIESLNGKEVGTWEEVLNQILLSPDSTVAFGIERRGRRIEKAVEVEELPEIKGGYVGAEPMFFIGNEAVVDGVVPRGPAARAGIRAGDEVLSFDGMRVSDWLDLADKVDKKGGEKARIVVERNGMRIAFSVQPAYNEEFDRWLIGISKNRLGNVPMTLRRYGFFEAIAKGAEENIKMARLTLGVLGRLVTLRLSYKVLGGPIMIAKTSAAAAASGIADFLYFLAFLSLQLSILNFLPIPVLDGGHMVFLGIEAVMRKPVSARVRQIASQVGFAVLVSLMLLITFNDIDTLWGIRSFFKRIF